MTFHVRPGLVMEEVCGQQLLVATLGARELCPYLTQLNDSSAFMWKRLLEGQNEDALADAVSESFGLSRSDALTGVRSFLLELQKMGFLVIDEEMDT